MVIFHSYVSLPEGKNIKNLRMIASIWEIGVALSYFAPQTISRSESTTSNMGKVPSQVYVTLVLSFIMDSID